MFVAKEGSPSRPLEGSIFDLDGGPVREDDDSPTVVSLAFLLLVGKGVVWLISGWNFFVSWYVYSCEITQCVPWCNAALPKAWDLCEEVQLLPSPYIFPGRFVFMASMRLR